MRGPSEVGLRRRLRIRLRPAFLLLFLSHSLLALVCSSGVWAEEDVDRRALLHFKAAVASDPSGVLAGWSDSQGSHYCSWPGVTCDSRSRVSALNISARSASPSCAPSSFRDRSCSDPKRSFSGKLASEIGQLSELKVLSLPYHCFDGIIPWEISSLEHLEVLDLEGNSLSGPIPPRFGQQLRVLCLAFNYLTGGVPESLVNSACLEIVDLSRNRLNGTVPLVSGKSLNLKRLDLSFNHLGGPVPDGICNGLLALEHLDLSGNMLTGGIPSSLGNCSNLQALLMFNNLLDGFIPAEIGRLWKLQVLDLSRNSLSGTVPAELGNCSELSILVLSNIYDPVPSEEYSNDGSVINDFNYFQGGIDDGITSLPKLRMLWAPRATLEGRLPSKWGACGSLEVVNLGQNLFTGGLPPAFGQCKYLKYLNLSSNKLTGRLHDDLPVPCMDVFDVSGNQLSGFLPNFTYNRCPLQFPTYDLASAYLSFFQRMAQLTSRETFSEATLDFTILHDFGRNNFTGNFPLLPVSIENLRKKTIYALLAGGNNLFGSFPGNIFDSCKNMKGLILNISNNMIYGMIPPEIDSICPSLIVLDISGNQISGTIPPHLGLLESLVALDLSRNKLHGQIPENLSLLKELKRLSLADNNLTGGIPLSLSQLYSLKSLDLSSNSLSGGIPGDLVKLRNLSTLLLNNNKLSGSIPPPVDLATSLYTFNVSFNNLSGPVPSNGSILRCDSVIGNPLLKPCPIISLSVPPAELQGRAGDSLPDTASSPGSSQGGAKGFTTIEIASISSAAAIVSVLLALIVLYVYTRYCAPRSTIPASRRRELTVFADIGVPLTYESVVRATGGFNANNCIGSGGFGATYKAEIAPGVVVAVKRLSVGRVQGVQQFHAEIKTLGRWRHPNLVTLIGFHVSEAEMFLIYNYLPGGNLENFIKERSKRPVDWRMLHKIALDVARALAYLHDHCVPRILHRDVKPSNILLDNEYNAYLSDFGLARLLGNSETHATTGVAGTFGYVAPEYAMTCRVSDKADVYSYGVVLLELISDKKALDPSFSPYGNGFNIVAWACMLLKQGRAREFFTEGLWNVGPRDDLVETLHLAIMCTDDSLSSRPTMKLVVQKLKRIQPPTCSPIRHITS